MSAHAYTEAIGLFEELAWAVAGPPHTAGVAGDPCDDLASFPRRRQSLWPIFFFLVSR
jgi:hypothetical protein